MKSVIDRTAERTELNFSELGAYLQISREMARRLCVVDRKIPFVKFGSKTYRVRIEDARKYKDSQTIHAL